MGTFPSAPRRTASLLARATTLATLVLRMPAPVLRCSRTLVPAPTFPSAPRRTASLLARATTLATLVLRMPAPVLHCSRTLDRACHLRARLRRAPIALLTWMDMTQDAFTHLLLLWLTWTMSQ